MTAPAVVPARPAVLRTVVFIDGENLRKTCYALFNWAWCHPLRLAEELVAIRPGRHLAEVRYYSGVHDPNRFPDRAAKMSRRLNAYRSQGVHVETRTLKYGLEWVVDQEAQAVVSTVTTSGSQSKARAGYVNVRAQQVLTGREKGIDVRLCLDLIRLAIENRYDLAIVVSGDSDIDEAVKEVFDLRPLLRRWLTVENAVPKVEGRHYVRLWSCKWVTFIDEEMFKRASDNTAYLPPPVDRSSPT